MSNPPRDGSHHIPLPPITSAPGNRGRSQQQTQALGSLAPLPTTRSGNLERMKTTFTPATSPLSAPGIATPPHAALAPQQVGLSRREATALKSQAVRTGTDIYVRDGNPSRLPHLNAPGTRPKPAGLYNKTDKTTGHPGLVVTAGKALDDHSGLGFQANPTGLVHDRHGNTVHGDIDLQRVDRGGTKVPAPEYLEALNTQLNRFSERPTPRGPQQRYSDLRVAPSDKVQHGAHDEWDERNNMAYAGGLNAGPIPGVTKFSASGRNEHYSTTTEYRQELRKKGAESTYTRKSWMKGAQRDTEVRTAHSNPVQVTRLSPRRSNPDDGSTP